MARAGNGNGTGRGTTTLVATSTRAGDGREAAFRALADEALAGLCLLDEELRYLYVNERLAEMNGVPAGEHVGRHVWEVARGVPVDRWDDLRHALDRGEARTVVMSAPTGDGTRLFTVEARPLPAVPGGAAVACSIVETTDRDQAHEVLERQAAEFDALRRLATVVAAGGSADAVFGLVAEEVVVLLGADQGGVVRFEDEGTTGRVVATWSNGRMPTFPSGVTFALQPKGVLSSGRPGVFDLAGDDPDGVLARLRALGAAGGVAAPIRADGRLWGAVAVIWASDRGSGVTAGAAAYLERVAELVGMAVANADARARLIREATSDPLTGLANHRAFQERLRTTVAHARRHGSPVALLVFDVDFFKQINDLHGHQAGDDVLIALAERVGGAVRDGELFARLGGDEFALLLPSAACDDAMNAAQRIRASVAERPLAGHAATISVGVCTLEEASDADELMRLADGALYWTKAHGRNGVTRYTAGSVAELSATERAERLERGRALAGVRALARAVDARDRSTQEHSERVAAMAMLLARASGWPADRAARLHDVALIHDVGKIGVPDHLLQKSGRLSPSEYDEVKTHAALGAQIAAEVLDEEQTAWVRGHHERPDGAGYPDGLGGAAISDGAALLALADAWDAMLSDRPYATARTVADAVAECRRAAGLQFTPAAVAALERLDRAGLLDGLRATG